MFIFLFRFSPSNSPIESFNNTIKTQFTKRVKYTIIPSLKIFKHLIKCQTTEEDMYLSRGKVNATMNKQAIVIINQNLLIPSSVIGIYYFAGYNDVIYNVNIHNKTCSCYKFIDKAVCKHLAAACLQNEINLNGLKKKPLRLRYVYRKKAIQKSTSLNSCTSISCDTAEINNINESISIQPVSPTKRKAICITSTHKNMIQNDDLDLNVAKVVKRGRPALASKTINSDHKENQQPNLLVKRGRPLSSKSSLKIVGKKYCLCKKFSTEVMIGCDNSKCSIEWYHLSYVELNNVPEGKWYCHLCMQNS